MLRIQIEPSSTLGAHFKGMTQKSSYLLIFALYIDIQDTRCTCLLLFQRLPYEMILLRKRIGASSS